MNVFKRQPKPVMFITPGTRPARVLNYLEQKAKGSAPWASNPELQQLLGLTQTCQVGRVLRVALREKLVKQRRVADAIWGGPPRVWWRIAKDGK